MSVDQQFNSLNDKLQQLLKQYQVLQKENGQLANELKELKTSRENDLNRINQLEQQVGILKSAAGKMEEADKKLFEKHINQYIREIDKCIGLLSE